MLPYVFLLWCVMSLSSLYGVLSEEQLIQTTSEIRNPGKSEEMFDISPVLSEVQLIQTTSEIRKTEESVKMSCKTSGFTFTSVYMHWIQQEPGKGFKWIGRIDPEDGETIYSETYKERFTMTTDNSISTAYLQIDRLTLEDSATYYCARGYFDIWGPGTLVTVTSAETRGPSVFPLVPCCDSLSSDQVSIGCLSTGYLPTPVDVQWNSGSITGGIRNFPAVLGKQGTYLSTSLLTIPTSEWTSDKKFVCNVNHKPSGVKINKEIEACSSKTSPPTVEVMQASCGESGSVDLVCLILGYTPSNIKVEWLLNGEPTSIIPSNSTPYKESDGTFGSRSKVSVPKQDWIAGDRYTCKVSHPASETKNEDTIHKCPVPENLVPKVVVLPPTPKDILISKQPKVVCQVSQVESPESLKISWKREDGKKILAFSSEPEIDAFGRYTVKSTLKISLSDWLSGQSCTCIVQNNELPSPIEKSIKKTEAPATDPSVYVFPPQADELKIHDFVSVPCLIKGFKPKEIYVQWKKNGYVQDENHYTNSEPMQQDDEETYFIYSTLMIEKSDWNRGAALTCSAVHSKITEKTIKKSNGK